MSMIFLSLMHACKYFFMCECVYVYVFDCECVYICLIVYVRIASCQLCGIVWSRHSTACVCVYVRVCTLRL